MKEEWRSAAMEYGGPSMTMGGAGTIVMPSLSADNLDTKVNLKHLHNNSIVHLYVYI